MQPFEYIDRRISATKFPDDAKKILTQLARAVKTRVRTDEPYVDICDNIVINFVFLRGLNKMLLAVATGPCRPVIVKLVQILQKLTSGTLFEDASSGFSFNSLIECNLKRFRRIISSFAGPLEV
jgi:hypothetical protein